MIRIGGKTDTPHIHQYHFVIDDLHYFSFVIRMLDHHFVTYLKFHGAKLRQTKQRSVAGSMVRFAAAAIAPHTDSGQ